MKEQVRDYPGDLQVDLRTWDMARDYLAPHLLFEVKSLTLMCARWREREGGGERDTEGEGEREVEGGGRHRDTDREGLVERCVCGPTGGLASLSHATLHFGKRERVRAHKTHADAQCTQTCTRMSQEVRSRRGGGSRVRRGETESKGS